MRQCPHLHVGLIDPGGGGGGGCGGCQLPLTRLGSAASHGSRTSATASGKLLMRQCPHLHVGLIDPGGGGGGGGGGCGGCQLPLTRLGSAASHGSRTSATASGQSSIGQCPHLTRPLVVTWRSPAASSSLKCFAMLPSQGVQGSSSPHATRMGQLSCAAVASGLGPGSPVNTLHHIGCIKTIQWHVAHS